MPRPDRSNALDHMAVIRFENRSLDNLLVRLYGPGEVPSSEGVAGLDLARRPGGRGRILPGRSAARTVAASPA